MSKFLDRCEDVREAAEKDFLKSKASLKSRAIDAYVKKTLDALEPLLEKSPLDTENLKIFFAVHWEQYKHTPFSYTALPEHGITKLLWFVAQEIVRVERKGKESSGILSILMPDLNKDPINNFWPELYPTERNHWKDVGLDVLKTHILGDTGTYLIPVKDLAGLSCLPNERSRIVNPYHDALDESLENQGHEFLNNAEFSRLTEHSDASRELVQLFKEYEDFVNQDSSLYGQLAQLCKQLYFNSVSARGQEEDAGAGAYTAIARFNEYYEALSKEEKIKVPDPVKSEIEKIQRLASPYGVTGDKKGRRARAEAIASELIQDEVGSASAAGPSHSVDAGADEEIKARNATRQHVDMLDTCLAIRRTSLSAIIEVEREVLSNIGLGDEEKEGLLETKKKNLETAKDSLKKSIEKDQYVGAESFPVSKQLLDQLDVNFSVSCEEDLQEFKLLSPEEIRELLNDKCIKEDFILQLKQDNQLALFFFDISSERLNAVLSVIILDNNILSKLASLANPHFLGEERCYLVIQSFLERISSAKIFNQVFEYLSNRRRTELFNALTIESILGFINSAENFKDVFEFLPIDLRQDLFSRLTEGYVLNLIQSAQDFNHVFKVLSEQERAGFLRGLTFEKVVGFIQSSNDLSAVLQFLDEGERSEVLTALTIDGVFRFIGSAEIFEDVSKALSGEQRQELFARLPEERILGFIQSAQDFNHVFRFLDDSQKADFLEKLTLERVVGFIQSSKDLSMVLQFLDLSRAVKIINGLGKDKIDELIDSIRALRDVTLFRQQIADVLGWEKIASLIVSEEDLLYVFINIFIFNKYSEWQQVLDRVPVENLKTLVQSLAVDYETYPLVLEAFLKKTLSGSELSQVLTLPEANFSDELQYSNLLDHFRHRSEFSKNVLTHLEGLAASSFRVQQVLSALKNIAWRFYICNGDLGAAQKLFELEPERSLRHLRLAVIYGKDAVYAWLLKQYGYKGNDLTYPHIFAAKVQSSSETSDLLEAIKGNHFKIVEQILSIVDPPPEEEYFHDILLAAVQHNALEVVWGVLLKINQGGYRNLSLNKILKGDGYGKVDYKYFLQIAIQNNRADIVRILSPLFEESQEKGYFLEDFLLRAVESKNEEIVELLAPYTKLYAQKAFKKAISNQDAGMVGVLLSAFSPEKNWYAMGNLLTQAVEINAVDIVRLLLPVVDVSALQKPMEEAIKNKNGPMVAILFEVYLKSDVESKAYFQGECLKVAAKEKNLEAILLFMPHVSEHTTLDVLKESFAAGRQDVVDLCVTSLGAKKLAEPIYSKDTFVEMFNCLDAQWRERVFNELGSKRVSDFFSNVSGWLEIKEFLTDEQRRVVVQNNQYLTSMINSINSASDLAQFSQYWSDEQRAKILDGLGIQKLVGFVKNFETLEQSCSIFSPNIENSAYSPQGKFLDHLGPENFFGFLHSAQDLEKLFIKIKPELELSLSRNSLWQEHCSNFLLRIEPGFQPLLSLPSPLSHEIRPFLLRTLTRSDDIKASFDALLKQALEHKRPWGPALFREAAMSDQLISGLCAVAENNSNFKDHLIKGLGLQMDQHSLQEALETYRSKNSLRLR